MKIEEPLRLECQHFLECLRERRQPLSDGADGLRVLKILAAAQRSLKANGMPIAIDSTIHATAEGDSSARLTAIASS
jgi:predicted dehydrogenase